MLNCLMYKLCYYRFGEVQTEMGYFSNIRTFYERTVISSNAPFTFILHQGKPTGYDRVRSAEIGNKDVRLERLEEAFTSGTAAPDIHIPPNKCALQMCIIPDIGQNLLHRCGITLVGGVFSDWVCNKQ